MSFIGESINKTFDQIQINNLKIHDKLLKSNSKEYNSKKTSNPILMKDPSLVKSKSTKNLLYFY